MSERHAGALDQIEDYIDNAGDDASRRSRFDINEAVSAAQDAMSTTVARLRAEGTPITREAVEQGIRELLGDLDPTGRQGLDNYLALHFGKDLDDIANDTRSLSASEEDDVYEEFRGLNLAEQKVWLADNNGEIPHEVWGRLNAEHRQGQTVRSLDRSVTADATKTSSALTGARAQDIIENAPNGQEGNADQLGSSWLVGANKAALAATEQVSKEGGSQDEQEAAAKAAYEQHSRWWQEVAGDGSDYDVERMNEINQESPYIVFSQEDIQAALDISRKAATEAARFARDIPEGMDDEPEIGLMHGHAGYRAFIDNIDNTLGHHKQIAQALKRGLPPSVGSVAKINKLNAGTVEDARSLLATASVNTEGEATLNLSERLFTTTPRSERFASIVRADGVYSHKLETDPSPRETNRLLQAIRTSGVTPEMADSGIAYGLKIKNFPVLSNPKKTLWISPDSYEGDLQAIAKINTPLMPQEELLTHPTLSGNEIIEGYKAYSRFVGINNSMGFVDFVKFQVQGIGQVSLPYPDAEVLKQLDAD